MQEFYKVLGINSNASKSEIEAAFNAKQAELQAQITSGDPNLRAKASQNLTELTNAYVAVIPYAKDDAPQTDYIYVPEAVQTPGPVVPPVPPMPGPMPGPIPGPQGYPNHSTGGNNNNNTIIIVAAIVGALLFGTVGYFVFNKFVGGNKNTNRPVIQQQIPSTQRSQPLPSVKYGVITGTDVRLRSYGDKTGAILGHFDYYERVTILEVAEKWTKVRRANGQVGWVSNDYCRIQ